MKLCETCGNDIDDQSWKCPFCEHVQVARGPSRSAGTRKSKIATVNLEAGRPTVPEALDRLDRELASFRHQRTAVVRVIHGYGSTGVGGKIKGAVRKRLAAKRKQKMIRSFVPGDDYSGSTGAGKELLSTCPALRNSVRTDRHNPGITFVVL